MEPILSVIFKTGEIQTKTREGKRGGDKELEAKPGMGGG